jgi:outer membrane immunogenic protein
VGSPRVMIPHRGDVVMKMTVAIAGIVALIGAPAVAADMAVKAQPPLPLPPWSWTGFYVGGQIGGGWATTNWYEDASESGSSGIGPVGFQDGSVHSSGPLGGGQVGFDYQVGWAVFGIQADADAANISGSAGCFSEAPLTTQSCTTKIDALGTVTGRVGAAFDRVLVYALGGWAWENEKLQNPCSGCVTSNFVFSGSASGATLGAGIEYAFAQNWSAFLQYNYMGFGTRDLAFTFAAPAVGLYTENVQESINVVKVGINYRFGPYGPIATRY